MRYIPSIAIRSTNLAILAMLHIYQLTDQFWKTPHE
jgi:hypothetical protein